MLDIKAIADNVESVTANCADRGVGAARPGRVAELHEEVASLARQAIALRTERNEVAKAARGKSENALRARERGAAIRSELQEVEAREAPLQQELLAEALLVPNTTHPRSPVGGEDEARRVAHFGSAAACGAPPAGLAASGAAPLDHLELAESLGLVDFDAAARSTGPKFSMLTGAGAMLELGIAQQTLAELRTLGFTPVLPPDVAHHSIVSGCGFQPRGDESNIYPLDGTDLCLTATSEIALAGMHADSILPTPADSMPRMYAAFSHCFRREAGAAGRASRGLYRLHQFSKVEMMVVCEDAAVEDAVAPIPERLQALSVRHRVREAAEAAGGDPDEAEASLLGERPRLLSDAWLEVLSGLQMRLAERYGLSGRVLDMPTRELGASAHRKFDLEAWMPGRDVADGEPRGAWGEISSASNCTDFQARRLGLRYRHPETGKPTFAHTLNATAAAVPRLIVAMLETHQQPDGSVVVPEGLRAAVGTDRLEPVHETRRGIHARG